MVSDRGPFPQSGPNNTDEWYCIVGGRRFGPWPDRGSAAAGFATEKARRARKEMMRDEQVKREAAAALGITETQPLTEEAVKIDVDHRVNFQYHRLGRD